MSDGKVKIDTELDDSGFKKGISKLGGIAKGALSATAAGLAAVGTAAVKMGKDALVAYSDFEQLSQGAQLMFGDAYDFIAEKAQDAYKNVQLSQSEYLEQVNGFAVSLRESLGGNERAAAELADNIVTAEADIVAATGQSQEAIQNAFNGVLRGQYQMLDNLHIGIKPTKEGLQEVIDKVNEWNAAQGRQTNYSMDSLADQQAALVDYVEMIGFAGYAADEALHTISGATAATKSAWENLIVGIADDNADFEKLVDNFITVLVGDGEGGGLLPQVIPRIETIIEGLGKLVGSLLETLVPQLLNMIPQFLESALPVVLSAFQTAIEAIVSVLPDLLSIIVDNLPSLFESGASLILTLFEGLSEALPELLPQITAVILQIVETLTAPESLNQLTEASITLTLAFIDGLIKATPDLLLAVGVLLMNLGQALYDYCADIYMIASVLMWNLIEGIKNKVSDVVSQVRDVATAIGDEIKALPGSMLEWGRDMIDSLVEGIKDRIEKITTAASEIASTISSYLHFSTPDVGAMADADKWMPDMIDLLVGGIDRNKYKLAYATDSLSDILATVNEPTIYNKNYQPNYSERVVTRNNNTVQTVKIVAEDEGLFRVVKEQEKLQGEQL